MTWSVLFFSALTGGIVAGAFWLKGRELVAPVWLRDRIEAQLELAMPELDLRFGDVVAVVQQDWRPSISVRDLELRTKEGAEIISVSSVSGSLDKSALLQRQVGLKALEIDGVFLKMNRSRDGAIALSAGLQAGSVSRQAPNLAQLVADMDEFLLRPELQNLTSVDMRAITLRYEDLRAERAWTIDGGRMRLERENRSLQIALDLAILGGNADVATMSVNYAGEIGKQASDFGFTIANLDAGDIASQGPAFSWLQALEAPISGALRGGLSEDGSINPLNATLQIGSGVIQPTPEATPIPINGAQSYFSYLPDEKRLQFDDFFIDSKWGSGRLEGHSVLGNATDGQIEELVSQFRLSDLMVNPDDAYPEPVSVQSAELDIRLRFNPFTVEIGRLQVTDQGQVMSSSGQVRVGKDGWSIAMDAQVASLTASRLTTLWPEKLKPKTRKWIVENVETAQIRHANAAIRVSQGERPRIALGFDFEDAEFRFLKHLPLAQNAKGHGSLANDRFVIVVDQGGVTAPQGGFVDASGTSFIVPDTTAKPDPPGVVRLMADGSLTAALSLLNRPPLEVMEKVNLPADLALGQIALDGTLSFPLKKQGKFADVIYDVSGLVQNARTDRLVKDRDLEAETLALVASEEGVSLSGDGTIDNIPVSAAWTQQLGRPGDTLPGQVTGEIKITPETLEVFKVTLPPNTLKGEGIGSFSIDMLKGTKPRLTVQSDLLGLQLSVPPIGWSKSAATQGLLELALTMDVVPDIDKLSIQAPGLQASGSVRLNDERQLDRVRLDRLRVGNWLDVPVDLVGRGTGRPVGVVVRGGSIDLRRAELPTRSRNSQASGPLTVALDRLQISDTIALTDMRGEFKTSGGISGSFQGLINGAAGVSGRMTPQEGRSAIQVTASDAGRVLAAAGISQQARDGKMQLKLVPVGTGGAFDGKLNVQQTRITGAPTIAALLNSISVVGLVNELNGDGIVFSNITADFRMAPSRITVRQASAEGPSMGLSVDGFFEPDTGRLNLQGVISPVYLINSIGRVLTRPGEGLIGFNYSITGTTENPQVFVNPLTALAPGMFRNLFRGAQPDVPLEEGEKAPVPEKRRVPVVTRGEDR